MQITKLFLLNLLFSYHKCVYFSYIPINYFYFSFHSLLSHKSMNKKYFIFYIKCYFNLDLTLKIENSATNINKMTKYVNPNMWHVFSL